MELEHRLVARGFKGSHAAPLLRAFYAGGAHAPAEAGPRRQPAGLRDWIAAEFPGVAASPARRHVAGDGTVKLLLRLYAIQGGEILLDGLPIHQLELADLAVAEMEVVGETNCQRKASTDEVAAAVLPVEVSRVV